MQPDGPITLLAFAGLNASLVRTKRCRYLTAPAHFSKAHNARAMCHNRLRSAGKTANGCLAAQRRGISLPMLECKHAIPCGNGTVSAALPPSGTRARISLQACIGLTGMGGFAPKEAKALLGMRQGSQICPAALVAQHRFRRPKKALLSAFRGRLRRNNHFGCPPALRDPSPHFPASLHRLDRHGWLCPEGSKSAAWDAPRFPNLPCGTGCAAQVQKA